MRDDRLALILTLRTETASPLSQAERLLSDVPRVSVGPLDDEAADRLLDDRRFLDRPARSALKSAAQGNPLALVALSADWLSQPPAAPLALAGHLEAHYRSRVASLPPPVRRLLLLAAADDTGDLGIVLSAAGHHGATEEDLALAEQHGLLTVSENRVDFVHPLVRSAIYQAAPSTTRRDVHLALADALVARVPRGPRGIGPPRRSRPPMSWQRSWWDLRPLRRGARPLTWRLARTDARLISRLTCTTIRVGCSTPPRLPGRVGRSNKRQR